MSQFHKGQAEAIIDRARKQGRIVAEFGGKTPRHGIPRPWPAPHDGITPGVEAPAAPPVKLRRVREPNKTEAAFRLFLEAEANRRQTDKIQSIRYEGLSLRWGFTAEAPPMVYTPDWVMSLSSGKTFCFEVKGGHIFDRDIVRFKGCRAEWPEFIFEMWQYKNREWTRLH